MDTPSASVCILADPRELADSRPIWGTGGWLPAEDRRALDWLTLCRLMGMGAEVVPVDEFQASRTSPAARWLVVACDSGWIDSELVVELETAVETRSLLLVCEATDSGHPLAEWLGIHRMPDTVCGRLLKWRDGKPVKCAKPLIVHRSWCHSGTRPLAWLDDQPIAHETPAGLGKAVVTAFDASELRDHDGAGGALLMHLFSKCAPHAHATHHWQGVLIPRMDDPGSSEALHHRIYDQVCLGRQQWKGIAAVLRKNRARISVGYVSGWVDSGGDKEGALLLDGVETGREPGGVHPSPRVCFERHSGAHLKRYDHREEYQALEDMRREGLLEVEIHGHTHIFPDRTAWLAASDRFESRDWFREFGPAAAAFLEQHPQLPHPIDEALARFREYFNRTPSTLICPGEVFTNHVLEKALERGLMQVSSYYLAFRDRDRLCWTQHVCGPYLDQPESAWFGAGLPVVGCFHDFDIARHGVEWLTDCFNGWTAAGCRRIIGLDDLNALLQLRMDVADTRQGWQLRLGSDPAWPLPRRFELLLHFPENPMPESVATFIDGKAASEQESRPWSEDTMLLEISR